MFGGCRWQAKLDAADVLEAQQKASQLQFAVDELADKTKAAEQKAKQAADALEDAQNEADKQKAEADRRAAYDARKLAAAIKRGTVRLSDKWACPATASAGKASADAADAASTGKADSLARIVAATDADKAAIEWLYTRWAADRKAVIDAGCATVGGNQDAHAYGFNSNHGSH